MTAPRKPPSVWKILGWAMVPAVILLLALVAIPLFWNWNVARRWEAYRKEALAEGKVLDLPALPPPIDPAQNFAAGPPFSPIPLDKNGDPLQPAALPGEWFPNDILPDLGKEQRLDLATAASHLKIPSGTDAEVTSAILAACDENLHGQWPAVLAAETRPSTRFGILYWPLPLTTKFPYVNLRTAVRVHELRALALLHGKRDSEALNEVRGALRIASAADTETSILGHMVHAQFVEMQTQVVWEGLALDAWSDTSLAALEAMLAPQRISDGYARMVDSERAFLNTAFDSILEHPASTEAKESLDQWMPGKRRLYSFLRAVARLPMVVRENKLLLNRQCDVIRTRIDEQGNWHPRDLPFDYYRASSPEKMLYLPAALALPDFSRPERRLVAVEARWRQARLAIALERFHRAHGAFPERLDAVVPQFLPAVLRDPVDGLPMRYARDAADHFRLWSIGDDREDDGGKPDAELTDVKFDLVWPGGRR